MSNGIYRVNATESTALQGYEAKEMSYFIRNDLGKDMTGSCSIVHNDKLYVCRKNREGKKRVYVADLNRYSFKDSVQIYEWWVLDGINADKMFVFDDVLYFSDYERGLCKISEDYVDRYTIENEIKVINSRSYSSEVFLDRLDCNIVVHQGSKIIREIYDTNDLDKAYRNFKSHTKVSFDNQVFIMVNPIKQPTTNKEGKIVFTFDESYYELLQFAYVSDYAFARMIDDTTAQKYKFEYIEYVEMEEEFAVDVVAIEDGTITIDNGFESMLAILPPLDTQYDIIEMYDEGKNYKLSDCYLSDHNWYHGWFDDYGNQNIDNIGDKDNFCFDRIELGINKIPFNFVFNQINFENVTFHYNKPVESYWYSKYNDLGRLDYLKTANNISFVPDINYGGYTNVGYKTSKNETSFYSLAERPDIDFESIDFENFSFGGDKMAKTYSSKKKIKNFSFIQLRMSSNDVDCSSIVSLGFRYKYTRNNKGVK
jgi:hypothetical protein